MKRRKYIYPILTALVILIAGFYAVDSNSKEASVFSLPDISGTTNVKKADKQPVKSLQELNDAIVGIADQVNPTVVTIKVTQEVDVPENPFFRFFGDPRQQGGRQQERRGVGSGVIVSKDGYILTNNHVVQDADEITVRLYNDEEYTGKVVGTDPETDIAVVKIDNDDNLPAVSLGNSEKLHVGEMVLALGSPENLAHSVSMGIISAKGRSIGLIQNGRGYENYLQTDAAINPGNSGGALVNMDGELVGINAAIASQSGGNEGIGFAIPINLAESVMKSLIKNGKVERAQLGILGNNMDRTLAQGLGLQSNKGILVNDVLDGSPADKAGLKQGDVILSLNGESVGNYNVFRTTIATSKPGTEVTLGIIRDGKKKDVDVTLGERDDDDSGSNVQGSDSNEHKNLGFRVGELTSRISQQLDLDPGQQGVVVMNVSSQSNAAQEGLARGDVITKVNKTSVNSVDDFNNAIEEAADSNNGVVLLQVIKQGRNVYIAFKL